MPRSWTWPPGAWTRRWPGSPGSASAEPSGRPGCWAPRPWSATPGTSTAATPHNLDRWVKVALETWARVLEAGEESGLVILLENVYEREPEPIRRVLEQTDHPRLRACLDTGHFNTWARSPLSRWLEALEPWLSRLHLHDNDGSFDQHLPIGARQLRLPWIDGLAGGKGSFSGHHPGAPQPRGFFPYLPGLPGIDGGTRETFLKKVSRTLPKTFIGE